MWYLSAMITVHHSRRARSVRVIWLLEELGIPYQVQPLEFSYDARHTPAYLAMHPLGQVPVIQDGELTLFESGAIVEYILERYGEGRLAPAIGSPARPKYLQWFHYGEASLARCISDIVRNRFGEPEAERVPAALGPIRRRTHDALAVVERALQGREYILGTEFSAADIMVSYGITMLKVIGEFPNDVPEAAGYLGRLKQRPGYQRAWA